MRILLAVIIAVAGLSASAYAQSGTIPQGFTKQHQPKFGIKVGYNFAKVIGSTPNYNPGNNNGYLISVFFSPSAHNGIGYRTEIIYSRQGFSFDQSGKLQKIAQDYIYMPQLTTFTIAHKVQLQAGGQIGYLINAKNTSSSGSGSNEQAQITNYLNRLDYGFAGGIEIYPIAGLIVGGRYNVSLGNIYKQYNSSASYSPFPFNPSEIKGKNAVVQFFIGYKF